MQPMMKRPCHLASGRLQPKDNQAKAKKPREDPGNKCQTVAQDSFGMVARLADETEDLQ
jgi:hypothetical protein